MIQKAERGQRWSSTGRTAAAGAGLGAAGGAITGALSLLGDNALSTGSALAYGVLYGVPFGALLGTASGLVSGAVGGAVGGCLAMHVVRHHAALARAVLTLCCALFIAAATAWSLPPGPIHLVGTVLAAAVAAAAAWISAPWCFRPLQEAGGPAV